MPFEIVPEPPGVRAAFQGVVEIDEILAAVEALAEVESAHTIFDLTEAETLRYSVEELHHVSTKARVELQRPEGYPCAVVGSGPLITEMTELYILVQEYLSGALIPAGSVTEMFDDLDEARRWVEDSAPPG